MLQSSFFKLILISNSLSLLNVFTLITRRHWQYRYLPAWLVCLSHPLLLSLNSSFCVHVLLWNATIGAGAWSTVHIVCTLTRRTNNSYLATDENESRFFCKFKLTFGIAGDSSLCKYRATFLSIYTLATCMQHWIPNCLKSVFHCFIDILNISLDSLYVIVGYFKYSIRYATLCHVMRCQFVIVLTARLNAIKLFWLNYLRFLTGSSSYTVSHATDSLFSCIFFTDNC